MAPASPGAAYCGGILVRVVAGDFVAGIIIDRTTRRAIFAAPILAYLIGRNEADLRKVFRVRGWRATIVRRGADSPATAASVAPDGA
jgi:hypothetical protein